MVFSAEVQPLEAGGEGELRIWQELLKRWVTPRDIATITISYYLVNILFKGDRSGEGSSALYFRLPFVVAKKRKLL